MTPSRKAPKLVLERTADMEIDGPARTLAEGRDLTFGEDRLDVVVVDPMLPDGDGASLISNLETRRPETAAVVLSAQDDLGGALENGADAAIRKNTPTNVTARQATAPGERLGPPGRHDERSPKAPVRTNAAGARRNRANLRAEGGEPFCVAGSWRCSWQPPSSRPL